ncbi:hypothetical protein CU026_1486 [Enterococcus faecium]|nr:hypothetical protein [Enterococcus faecium]MBL5012761.1 hypothetical protein [Enterococcus lactis]MBK4756903.1 hypothetical protein [Enterococcus faecium]MBK4809734.1 hypothetical protein [Enterococcus faecium]MBK4814681.1 hypothetical protein [Enterococcus faecium]
MTSDRCFATLLDNEPKIKEQSNEKKIYPLRSSFSTDSGYFNKKSHQPFLYTHSII